MKILIDTDDEKAIAALAGAIADKLIPLLSDVVADRAKAEAPAAAAPAKADKPAKAPAKPAAAPKADDGAKAPVQDDVLAALREYSGPKEANDYAARKAASLAILNKYSKTLAELPADKYQTVIDAIKALGKTAAVEDDF